MSSRSAVFLAVVCLGCGAGAEFEAPDAGASTIVDSGAAADAGSEPDAGVTPTPAPDAGTPDAGGPPPIINPVLNTDFPDPHVVRIDGLFHAWGTNISRNGVRHNIPHAVSSNLTTWVFRNDALPAVGSWADGNDWTNWAPGVLVVNPTRTVLFYVAKRAGTGQQCIGRAVAANANGPFVDNFGSPLICNTTSAAGFWSIDPSPFRDADGKLYLLWRQDFGSPVNNRAAIRQLAADGTSFAAGSTELGLVSRGAGSWEDPVLENPAMVRLGGKYWLFYSANRWETAGYAVGYAECASVTGPCTKKTANTPWLSSIFALAGPGGQDFFTDDSGQTWMSLHGWVAPDVGYPAGKRALWVYRFGIENGVPKLSAP